jgi:hypothetical protein
MALISVSLLALSGVWFSVFSAGMPPAASGIAEAYLAKDNGNGEAGEETAEFGTDDIPIHCVVILETAETATVKMELIAVQVSGVKPNSKVFKVSYTTKRGEDRVNFEGRPDGEWRPGKYRIDLFYNGKRQEELPFTVNGKLPPVKRSGPPIS